MSTFSERFKNSMVKRRVSWRHLVVDIALMLTSLYLSLFLRVGFRGMPEYIPSFLKLVLIFLAIKIICQIHFKVYNAIWRYLSVVDVSNLLKGIAASTAICIVLSYLISDWAILPRSYLFIDGILTAALLIGVRFFRRILFEKLNDQKFSTNQIKVKTLIYGSDLQVKNLLQDVSFKSNFEAVGILTDDKRMWKRTYNSIPVLGNLTALPTLLRNGFANHVVIAHQNVAPEVVKEIFEICRPYNIRPLINQINAANFESVDTIRKINLEDFLPRQSHEIDISLVRELLKQKNVLVTGAGGSIGSELCRQISRYSPHSLVMLDHSEFALYEIDSELRSPQFRYKNIIPVLTDVKNKKRLQEVFEKHSIDIVFHAAAYKHVHLVEDNIYSSIENNVVGTLNLLECVEKYKTPRFILISTDKAVNPVGVMGATKRLCEILTSLIAKKTGQLFCSVRFGNVLGSSGSLIPLLKQQIENNKPVTVTHPDITRYFMLIPEAVSLVLMTSVISKAGDINVLKMGKPVKILDIAKALIATMGKSENEVPIIFTGLRPGEKMYEELYLSGKELQTNHPDILTLPDGDTVSTKKLEDILKGVYELMEDQSKDIKTKDLLMNLIH